MNTRLLTIALCMLATGAAAQDQTVTINDLSAPTSAAFVLLDVAPTAVERPETAKAFVVNTVNKLSRGNGFPKDFALEVAPYWMMSHPGLTFDQHQNPGVLHSIKQSFAISAGTAPIPGETRGSDPRGTHVAIGFTLKPWNGRASGALTARISKLETVADVVLDLDEKNDGLEAERAGVANAIDALEEKIAQAKGNDTEQLRYLLETAVLEMRRTRLDAAIDAIANEREAAIANVTAQALAIQALDAQRVGFFLTISGGQVWDFLADDARNARARRRGLWVTPGFRKQVCTAGTATCESTLDVLLVSRALKDPDTDASIDVGGRLVWRPIPQFNLSAEFVRRKAAESAGESGESTEDSNRTAAMLEYRIREDLILYGTFGQDFKKATGAKPLVSALGLNLGFGSKPRVVARKTP